MKQLTNRILLAFCISVLIVSCNSQKEKNKEVENPDKEFYNPDKYYVINDTIPSQNIKGEFLLIDTPNIHSNISISDSYLLISNSSRDGLLFSVMNTQDDSIIARFGSFGHAKNEFTLFPNNIYFKKSENKVMMYALCPSENYCTKIFDFTNSISENKLCYIESKDCPIEEGIFNSNTNYYFYDEDNFLYKEGISYDQETGKGTAPRLVLNMNGERQEINLYPSLSNIDLLLGYAYFMNSSPDLSKAVDALSHMGIMTIIDFKTGKTIGVKISNAKGFKAIDTIVSEGGMYNYEKFFGRISTSNKYIFILKAETEQEKQMQSNAMETLLVLDWDGSFIGKFDLGKPIKNVAFDDKTNILYGIDKEGFGINKYDLSKYLK